MLFVVAVVTKCRTALVLRCCWVQRLLQLVYFVEMVMVAAVDCMETEQIEFVVANLQLLDQTATVNYVGNQNESWEQFREQKVRNRLPRWQLQICYSATWLRCRTLQCRLPDSYSMVFLAANMTLMNNFAAAR